MGKQLMRLLWVVLLVSPLGAVVRQDDFQRADGALGANWTSTLTSPLFIGQIGGVYGPDGEADAVWQGDDFGDDQFSEFLVRTVAATWVGVWARRQTSGASQGYLVLYFSGEARLYAHNGGWNHIVSVAQAYGVGDRLRIVVSGSGPTRVQAFHNGTQIIDVNDSAYNFTGGQPGFAATSPVNGSVESWAGGDGDGSGIAHPTPPVPWRRVPGGMTVQNLRVVDGVTWLDVVSEYVGGTPTVRYLLPTSPVVGMTYRFLHLLPVGTGVPDTPYGDAMDEARSLGWHNTYNAALVAPNFSSSAWVADHASDATKRDESFLVLQWAPWVELNFGKTAQDEHWLIGFSRSGFGGVDLLMRNPGVFDRGAFWDLPADWTWAELEGYGAHGTQANFDNNYKLTQAFITAHAAPFTARTRIWVSEENVAFTGQHANLRSRFDTASVKHIQDNTGAAVHLWTSGWMPYATAAMNRMYDAEHKGLPMPVIW